MIPAYDWQTNGATCADAHADPALAVTANDLSEIAHYAGAGASPAYSQITLVHRALLTRHAIATMLAKL